MMICIGGYYVCIYLSAGPREDSHRRVATSSRCRCGCHSHGRDHSCHPDPDFNQHDWVIDDRFWSIPGVIVPPFMFPFVEEMTAKSDDKTVVVTNLPRHITEDIHLLELFKPFGEVTSAKLAAIDP
jgi:hypothetical protein